MSQHVTNPPTATVKIVEPITAALGLPLQRPLQLFAAMAGLRLGVRQMGSR